MLSIEKYQKVFVDYLNDFAIPKEPNTLYEPIAYILKLGGKRLRPVLTLMTTAIFDEDLKKSLDAALAIKVFQRFKKIN